MNHSMSRTTEIDRLLRRFDGMVALQVAADGGRVSGLLIMARAPGKHEAVFWSAVPNVF